MQSRQATGHSWRIEYTDGAPLYAGVAADEITALHTVLQYLDAIFERDEIE